MSKEIEEIQKVYEEINSEFIKNPQFNTKETRHYTMHKLLFQLEASLNVAGLIITCDETNNSPKVIDNNQMIARVEWRYNKFDQTIHYVDLEFGTTKK
jgi:hypothetical protein